MSKNKKATYYSINQICKVIDCEHKTAPYVESSEYLVVRTSNVRNGNLILDDIKYTTKEGFIEWTKRAVPEHGDVLFTREAPAGESCLVPPFLKICMGQRMVLLRPKKELINPYFLSFYLNTREGKREIYQYVIGSTVTRINIDDILKIKIFYPSIAEQEKIASFLGAVDTRLNQLRRKREHLQTYKRGVMQKIFSQQIRFTQPDGSPFPDWEKKKLGEICHYFNGKSYEDKINETGQYSLITLNSIDIDGNLKSDHKKIDFTDNSLEQGDLVMVLSDVAHGNFLGRTNIIPDSSYVLNQRMGGLKTKIDVNIYFLIRYINHNQHYFRLHGQGSSQKNLSKGDVLNFCVKFPLLKEQEKIASFLTILDRKIEALSRKIDQTEQFKKGLLQKLFV